MVKITFSPTKELVIHEISERKPDDFYTLMIQQAQAQGAVGITPSVHWASGIAFTFGLFPETPDIVKDKLEGKIHYGTVVFAPVPEFRADAVVRIQGTEYHVRLQNAESNPILSDLAKFLQGRSWVSERQIPEEKN